MNAETENIAAVEKVDFLEWCDQRRIQVSVVRSRAPDGTMVWRTSCVPSFSIKTDQGFMGTEGGGCDCPSAAIEVLAERLSGATVALGGQYEKTIECPKFE